ncbi:hypothetical protein QVD17_31426 [Tagetes erecta]|uniref:PGG domain-containing protein n=1 Tax=Tagetes erecta TaxID=13708 RepID=A0AAD8K676_TARER|nr:hypothetical protein QVD17_31426 [Tagetes erecta]
MMKQEQAINIPNTSHGSLQYLFGSKEDYLNMVVPLYEASIVGDWETAKVILDKRRDLVRFGLSKNLGTILHVAMTAEETKDTLNFVRNLVTMMTTEELELKNKYSNTPFWMASASGNMKAAMIMWEKNHSLLNIRGNKGYLPLSIGVTTGTHTMVKWLYNKSQKMTGDHWTNEDKSMTLIQCLKRNFLDVALQIVEDHPELARNVSVLEGLARKPCVIFRFEKNLVARIKEPTCRFFDMKVHCAAEDKTNGLKLLKLIWGHVTRTMNVDEIEGMMRGHTTYLDDGAIQYPSRLLFVAAESGNTRFVTEVLRTNPDLMFDRNEDGLTIFHIAVMNRQYGIYNILYEIGTSRNDICTLTDHKTGNNMLHLVGNTSKKMAAKTSTSLLMQRELMWFKEVHSMMPSYLREAKNKDGQTPYELFSKENEEIISSGLKWMRDCIVVATLIITVAFTATFTFNPEEHVSYIEYDTFYAFVISSSICLFSSSTSLLVFLSILTSRHKHYFVYSFPRKLMIGLLALFISVVAMLVSFSVGFFVLYDTHRRHWLPNLIAIFASLSIIVFAILQFPLLMDMFRSMYDYHYMLNPSKGMLYTKKPRSSSSNSP